MIDESLVLTYNGGSGFKSIATADADYDATLAPGVLAWLFVTDAISVGGMLHSSLRVRVASNSVVPTAGVCLVKLQFCAVPNAYGAVDLVTAVLTGGVPIFGTMETSTAALASVNDDIFFPLRQIPIGADYLQALISVYPSGSDGIDAGRLYMQLQPLDDNASYPMANGI
jgi:hypothetical protein